MSEPRPPSHLNPKATAEAPRSPEATMAILRAMMGENIIAPGHGKPKSMSLAKTWHRGVVSLLVVAGMSETVSMAMVKANFQVKSFVNLTPQVEETINEYFSSSGLPVTSVDTAGTIRSSPRANLTQPVYPGDQPGISTKHPKGEMSASDTLMRIVHDSEGRVAVTATSASAPAADSHVAMPFDAANPINKAAIDHPLAAAQVQPSMKPHTVPAWSRSPQARSRER